MFYNAARLAIQAGAAGIIVSNHGARQLDYVPATILALEEVHFLSFASAWCRVQNFQFYTIGYI